MFIGHFGIGFGAKKAAPKISLGMLFIAAQFLDLLWPVLVLLGIEHVVIKPGVTSVTPLDFTDYPISHSLVMALFWSFLLGAAYWFSGKNIRNSTIIGICVLSHWILDLIVHAPDLPLYPGTSPKLGFGLWNSFAISQIVEWLIFIAGVVLYLRTTSAKNRKGSIILWILIGLMAVSHLANIFGPPPPGVMEIAWAGQLQWIFVLLAIWADRNRIVRQKQDVSKRID